MSRIKNLDAHEAAPGPVRDLYKHYQKLSRDAIDHDISIIDFQRGLTHQQQSQLSVASRIASSTVYTACQYLGTNIFSELGSAQKSVVVYEIPSLPGLRLIPSLLSQQAQEDLLSNLLHENLANQNHKTNVHLHHQIPYYATLLDTCGAAQANDAFKPSFFQLSPDSQARFEPIDRVVHKPFTVSQFLSRKLRWITLGGQFDWTGKRYPLEDEPPFPRNIGNFVRCLFPFMKPEAAIVNIYRPGDVLSVHRDVSEESDKPLVSFSLGCEAIIIVGLPSEEGQPPRTVAVRLRSGDAVCLGGLARCAWHGVPQVLQGTSPDWLRDWPADTKAGGRREDSLHRYEAWRGWMSNKRVNLSVRQIRD